ncbi:MAG: hypothetical protein MUD01_22350 [Chloroflexaceae bacterium]|jgi:galactose mutarotase-like enzyme|nr:hypothetical protein [Chloroflexaceae bacterium]
MSHVSLTRTIAAGLDTYQANTGPLSLELIPALGGKISSLRDARNGREWLWRHPRLPYRRVAATASYTAEADTGGWDECFPTVAPCLYPAAPWQGAALPDHGELWAQAATFDVAERDNRLSLTTGWQGVALPYSFTRTLHLAAGSHRLRVDYSVANQSDSPLHFICCVHPLLALEPGMVLELPPEVRFNVWSTIPADLLTGTQGLDFAALPLTNPGLQTAITNLHPAGVALKLWSDLLPPEAGWATLRASDGALTMRWDVAALPQVAFWLNLAAWAGDGGAPYWNLGLEPCVGAQDSLADAVSMHQLHATLPPHGVNSWWFEVELSSV